MIHRTLVHHVALLILAWSGLGGTGLAAETLRLLPGVPVVVDASESLPVRSAA